jgi:ADP-ribosyl-[dinitrogen reductase] hydrolase
MLAGENTLDALVTRVLVESMLEQKNLNIDDFRSKYITFMTTPGSHNDTYAGTCHRMFFKKLRYSMLNFSTET